MSKPQKVIEKTGGGDLSPEDGNGIVPLPLTAYVRTLDKDTPDHTGVRRKQGTTVLVDPDDAGVMVPYEPASFDWPDFRKIVRKAMSPKPAAAAVKVWQGLQSKFIWRIEENINSIKGRCFPLKSNTWVSSLVKSPHIGNIEEVPIGDFSDRLLQCLLEAMRAGSVDVHLAPEFGAVSELMPDKEWLEVVKPLLTAKLYRVSGGVCDCHKVYVAEVFFVPLAFDAEHCQFKIGDTADGAVLKSVIDCVRTTVNEAVGIGRDGKVFLAVGCAVKAEASFKAVTGDGFEVTVSSPDSTNPMGWKVDAPSVLSRLYPYRDFCDCLKPMTAAELLGVVKSVIDDNCKSSHSLFAINKLPKLVNDTMTGFPKVRESVIMRMVMNVVNTSSEYVIIEKKSESKKRKLDLFIVKECLPGDKVYHGRNWRVLHMVDISARIVLLIVFLYSVISMIPCCNIINLPNVVTVPMKAVFGLLSLWANKKCADCFSADV